MKLRTKLAAAAAVTALGMATSASALTFATGDVMASVGSGNVSVYSSTGVFKGTLSTGDGGFTTGSTTDKLGNFYVTNFSTGTVSEFDKNGASLGHFATGYSSPESIVFDAAGKAYIGDASQNHIHQSPGGDLTVATQDRGTDWVDLAANQTTLYYTSEGDSILRYDTVGGQLSNFADGLTGGTDYALRILGDGGVLVADTSFTLRLDSTGAVTHTYSFGDSGMFSLNLTPDGMNFWTGSFATGNLYEVNLASGLTVQTIHTGSSQLFGVSVYGEKEAGGGGVSSGTPEPATWAMLVMGFGGIGAMIRGRRRQLGFSPA